MESGVWEYTEWPQSSGVFRTAMAASPGYRLTHHKDISVRCRCVLSGRRIGSKARVWLQEGTVGVM